MKEVNEAIVKKIKGLLAIANDHKDDEESQSAFLLAQKLMLKHNISMSKVECSNDKKDVIQKEQVTAYKKLFWWEKRLAGIISENFRVKYYMNLRQMESRHRKKAIMFFGYERDVELAKEMYILAYDALKMYSERFLDAYYEDYQRTRSHTFNVKDSYMLGFLEGLEVKFEEQVHAMQQEYGLMLLVPKEVENEYDEFQKTFSKSTPYKIPSIEEMAAYQMGYQDGNTIDYTRSTLYEEIIAN